MDENVFVVLVVACILTHFARDVYEVLKDRQIMRPDRTTFLVMFSNMVLLWVSWCLLCALDPYRLDLPNVIRYAGIALFGIGAVLFIVGLLTLGTLESYEDDLVTRGIYSRIRHPMYLAFMLGLIGLPLFFGGLFSFVLVPLFIANVLWWRYLEEKELEQRFVSYKEYKRVTLF
jgi:protein-S-isoprenylcysteine O-methyltransferase Ste14